MNFELFYETSGVCTDTRNIQPNSLFICLKGDNFNGNTFAENALAMGAKYVIADEQLFATHPNIIIVENALHYLQQLAAYHRNQFNIPVIGITGSNGKTTTKELTATVLSKKYNVLFTQGNLNNHIGVPLTLLKLTSEHEIVIIEMGANKFKDIEELCDIASPTHGIITNIGRAHLEGFLNFEGVLKTKLELYASIAKINGTIFYNADDELLKEHLPSNTEYISYSTRSGSNISGKLIQLNPFVEMFWQTSDYKSPDLTTQMIGKYNFYNFLAAVAIGTYFAVEAVEISEAIMTYTPSNNRSQVLKTDNNTLIMDAYNANPTSMKSALESFALIHNDFKIAILGDMFELGNESETEHQKILDLILQLNITALCIGKHFNHLIGDQYEHVIGFEDKAAFQVHLKNHPLKNQLVLLKGSRGIGLESIIPFL